MNQESSTGPTGHLAFTVAGRHHALPLAAVQEVLRLPMLQPTEGMPSHIAGLFNLRGQVVAVQNLAGRLGLPCCAPRASDNLIVLVGGHSALWVEEIEGVVELGALQQPRESGQTAPELAAMGTQLYHLLDVDQLADEETEPISGGLLAGIVPEERALLEARSETYLETPVPESATLRAVLSFELNGEGFAVDLPEIREIAPCPAIHPLPGAPAAYLGLASHRGEPLLVVDLRPLIGLSQQPLASGAKLLVIDEADGRLGIYTDGVREVLNLDSSELQPPILEHGPWEWVEGEWVVDGRPLSLLRLRPLLAQPGSMSPIA